MNRCAQFDCEFRLCISFAVQYNIRVVGSIYLPVSVLRTDVAKGKNTAACLISSQIDLLCLKIIICLLKFVSKYVRYGFIFAQVINISPFFIICFPFIFCIKCDRSL